MFVASVLGPGDATGRAVVTESTWSDGTFSVQVHGTGGQLTVYDRGRVAVGRAVPQAAFLQACQALTSDSRSLRHLIGAFSMVFWSPEERRLVAARDPLGLSPLYYREDGKGIALSDDIEALKTGRYDEDYLVSFVTTAGCPTDATIWAGVRPVPPGATLEWTGGPVRISRFWSVSDAQDAPRDITVRDAAAEFLRLLRQSLQSNLDDGHTTWCELSGGLDSSSIVSLVAHDAEARHSEKHLGGTVTYIDTLGNGDESHFVDAVLDRFGVVNKRIVDDWPWRDDGEPPPLTAQPTRDYPFYARDRLVARLVTNAGGTSLLTGTGPDHLFPIRTSHIPDLMFDGEVAEAVAALRQWAVFTRRSVWRTSLVHLVGPLLSPASERWLTVSEVGIPNWLRAGQRRWHKRGKGSTKARQRRRGRLSQAADLRSFDQLGGWLATRHATMPGLTVRHPYLYLPLVELCLQLPHRLRTNLACPKAVLRAALLGILPEKVRRRTTKAIIDPRLCWAFGREGQFLSQLLSQSILGDLGVVDPRALQHAMKSTAGIGGHSALIYAALALETWLSVQSGRRISGPHFEDRQSVGRTRERQYA